VRSPPGHGLAAERCPICFPKIGAGAVQSRPAQSPADDPVTCRSVCCRQAGTVTTVHAPLPQITRPRTGRTPRTDGGRKVTGTSEDGRLSSRISQQIRRRRNQRRWAKARSTTQRYTARSDKGATGGLRRRGPCPRREGDRGLRPIYGTRWPDLAKIIDDRDEAGVLRLPSRGAARRHGDRSAQVPALAAPHQRPAPGPSGRGHRTEQRRPYTARRHWLGRPRLKSPDRGTRSGRHQGAPLPRGKEKPVYIGLGTVVLIIVIIAVVMLLRRR
jgi:hypothetical protein